MMRRVILGVGVVLGMAGVEPDSNGIRIRFEAEAATLPFSTDGKILVVGPGGERSWVVHESPLADLDPVEVAVGKGGDVEEILGPMKDSTPAPNGSESESKPCPPLSPVRLADGICAPILWPEPKSEPEPIPLPGSGLYALISLMTLWRIKKWKKFSQRS
jgi:hypothetical protein